MENPTLWEIQAINPTNWTKGTPIIPTGALLLSNGGFLQLSDGNFLGIFA
jgi:hypothetical protein